MNKPRSDPSGSPGHELSGGTNESSGDESAGRANQSFAATRPARRERADAARNRERVLVAARRLFAERGLWNVSMSDVARAAGVAKGTVFHRFGDRSGLALALLDEHERELQERVLRGPPPLGPGAPAGARLVAFLAALADLTDEHRELLLEVDHARPAGRYRTGAYRAWAQHTALLVAELRPDADAELLADVLLAPLAADLVEHLRADRAQPLARLRAAAIDAAERIVRH
jgi:AcrR family transcriptional regulator